MPFSDHANGKWFEWLLGELKPSTVIDVGPGYGKYGRLIKRYSPETTVTGIEVWTPYVHSFNLENVYDSIIIADARQHQDYSADLVILGDILEHMSKDDALVLWDKVRSQAKAAMISMPIIHFPQGHEHGNPYEEHVKDDWTHDEIMSSFTGITGYRTFEVTGSYVAEFNRV